MIKAIETTYKSCRFRSRLEARYAVFFDELGVKWQYEPEGFELPGGTRYLPDFHIEAQGAYSPGEHTYGPWVEIKGTKPTPSEVEKMRQLCESLCSYGLLVWGQPGDGNFIHFHKEGHVDGTGADGCISYHLHADASLAIEAMVAARSARFEFGQSGALT